MPTTPPRFDIQGPGNANWLEHPEDATEWNEAAATPLAVYFGLQDYILEWMRQQGITRTYAYPSGVGRTGRITHPDNTSRPAGTAAFLRDGIVGPQTLTMLWYMLAPQPSYQTSVLADLRAGRVSHATMSTILSVMRPGQTIALSDTAVMPPYGRAIAGATGTGPSVSVTTPSTTQQAVAVTTTTETPGPAATFTQTPPPATTPAPTPPAPRPSPTPASTTTTVAYEQPPAPSAPAAGGKMPTWAKVAIGAAAAAGVCGVGYLAYRGRRAPTPAQLPPRQNPSDALSGRAEQLFSKVAADPTQQRVDQAMQAALYLPSEQRISLLNSLWEHGGRDGGLANKMLASPSWTSHSAYLRKRWFV